MEAVQNIGHVACSLHWSDTHATSDAYLELVPADDNVSTRYGGSGGMKRTHGFTQNGDERERTDLRTRPLGVAEHDVSRGGNPCWFSGGTYGFRIDSQVYRGGIDAGGGGLYCGDLFDGEGRVMFVHSLTEETPCAHE